MAHRASLVVVVAVALQEVQYKREGEDEVPEKTMQAYRFVKNAFVIPDNFEKNHKVRPSW